MNAIRIVSSAWAPDRFDVTIAADSSNAAFRDLIAISPPPKDDVRLATLNERYLGTRSQASSF